MSDKKRLIAVRDFIDGNLDEDLKSLSLASRFGYSDSTIRRQFKLLFKIPIGHYVLDKRMQQAYRLLLDQELTIGEIGCRVGYCNRSAFTTAFTRYFGVPPARSHQIKPQFRES